MTKIKTPTTEAVALTDQDLDQIQGGGASKAPNSSSGKGLKAVSDQEPLGGNPGKFDLGEDFAP